MSWLHDKTDDLLGQIVEVKQKKAYPFFRPFENIGSRVKVGDGSYINFTSNDYLGLSQDKRLIRAACEGTVRYGTGLGSARPQATSVRHEALEDRLAQWLGYESCAVFTTGYQALVGVLSTYLDDDTTVVVDKLSHASILDGVYMAQGFHPDLEVRYIKHNNPKALDKVLSRCAHQKKLVVVEGLYSVDGDLAPLGDFITVCKKHGAAVMVDDAHGLGTLGPTGRGVGEMHGVLRDIDFMVGTFSKSFGTIGGFVCADRALIDYMKLIAKSFAFSAALPLAQIEAAHAALDIIESDYSYIRRLESNKNFFRRGLVDLGLDIGTSDSHITPLMVRDQVKCLTLAAYMFHGAGVIVMPFIYPGVAKGQERLRCNVTAAHSKAEMGYTLEAINKVFQMNDMLPSWAETNANDFQRMAWLAQHKIESARNGGLPYVRNELTEAGKKAYGYARGWLNGNGGNGNVHP